MGTRDREIKAAKELPTDSGGFTLLELLVSLAISGIVLSGIFYVFDTSNKSYIVQEDIARMQQNVRIAKYYVERDLRMAAYGIRGLTYNQVAVEPLVFKNNVDDDANVLVNTDTLSITYTDDAATGCGTPPTGYNACDDNPQLLLKADMPPSSPEAQVQEELGDAPYSDWDQSCSCNGTNYNSPSFGYKVIITSPDGSSSDILVLTGVQNTGGDDKLQNSPNVTVDGVTWANTVLNLYLPNSTINFFNDDSLVTARYYIDDEAYLRREVGGVGSKIAENMEDMQMAFCGDYNNDGTVDVDDANDWFDKDDLVSGKIPASDLGKIRYVRVTMLARTSRQHEGVSSTRPTIEDHAGATQADLYTRKRLSFIVRIRNLGLDD